METRFGLAVKAGLAKLISAKEYLEKIEGKSPEEIAAILEALAAQIPQGG